MTINLNVPQNTEIPALQPRITVIGVGGAGGNAVNNMIASGLEGVDFVVANTDAQALAGSRAERRVQLGANITQGLGAGSRPDVGGRRRKRPWTRSSMKFRAPTWSLSPPAWAAAPAPAARR